MVNLIGKSSKPGSSKDGSKQEGQVLLEVRPTFQLQVGFTQGSCSQNAVPPTAQAPIPHTSPADSPSVKCPTSGEEFQNGIKLCKKEGLDYKGH